MNQKLIYSFIISNEKPNSHHYDRPMMIRITEEDTCNIYQLFFTKG